MMMVVYIRKTSTGHRISSCIEQQQIVTILHLQLSVSYKSQSTRMSSVLPWLR